MIIFIHISTNTTYQPLSRSIKIESDALQRLGSVDSVVSDSILDYRRKYFSLFAIRAILTSAANNGHGGTETGRQMK